jgi:hypothetical protein
MGTPSFLFRYIALD